MLGVIIWPSDERTSPLRAMKYVSCPGSRYYARPVRISVMLCFQ